MVKLEKSGAVFLPAAGERYGSSVYNVQNFGYYWSATGSGSYDAYCFFLYSNGAGMDYTRVYRGYSVRLVKDL